MIKLLIFLIVFGIYVFCTRCAFLFYQKSHYDPNGQWNNIEPRREDLIWTYCPYLNIFPAIDYLRGNWSRIQKPKAKINHFKPKN